MRRYLLSMRLCPQSERCRHHQKRHSDSSRHLDDRDAQIRIHRLAADAGSSVSTDRSGGQMRPVNPSRDVRHPLSATTFWSAAVFCRPMVAALTTLMMTFRVSFFRRHLRDVSAAGTIPQLSVTHAAFLLDSREARVVENHACSCRTFHVDVGDVVLRGLFLFPSRVLSLCLVPSLDPSHVP